MPVFLFTDIEGSTQLWELHGRAMADALLRHDAIVADCVDNHGGRVVKHTGDGVFAVFEAGDPLQCALEIQRSLFSADWGAIGAVHVRVALHKGEAEERDGDFFGSAVNRTARLLGAAWGGQVLVSDEIASTFDAPADATLQDYGVHMLKDLGYPQRIYGLVPSESLYRQFPPLRSLSTRSHNLPPQPTPFVGRKQELADIIERLEQPSCRLLSILGSGGMGKTRLSLQVAAEVIDSFAHGVFQVPLAPLSSTGHIYTTIADALHYPFAGADDPAQQLFNYLRNKEMLLVLDNFEHLMAGAGLVAKLLQHATRLKIIVTSRERLNLQEEWTYQLQGLPYPPPAHHNGIEQYGAAQLFLQNAHRVYPDFELQEGDKVHVAEIVRLVEGIPLGIELAAAWVRLLPCSEIAGEISASRDFLASTASNVPRRHQSLRAVFENSWSLLSPAERDALARLSIFRGGFRREAAQQVACANLNMLLALSDKSLVRRTATGRYEMLETLRQFAADKLEDDPSAQASAAQAHARHYLQILHQSRQALLGGAQREALKLLEPENENVREAWRWALAHSEWTAISEALDSLFHLYELRGWFQEGLALFEQAVLALEQWTGDPEEPSLLPMLLSRRGWFAFRLGQHESAQQNLTRSLDLARRRDQRDEIAFALYNLGIFNYQLGDYQKALADLQDSLAIRRAAGETHGIAHALSIMGIVARERGDVELAERDLIESLALYRGAGDRRGISRCLNLLGLINRDRGNFNAARELLYESLAICRELDDRREIAFACSILGAVLYEAAEYDGAREYCQESLEIREQIGERRGMAFSLHDLGNIARALHKVDTSWAYLRRALRIAVEIQAVPLALYVITGIAELRASTGRRLSALELALFILNQRSTFEMASERAAALVDTLSGQVADAELQELRLVARNRRFDDLVHDLLNTHA